MIEGMVNPSVAPEDEVRLSGQNRAVYERLCQGPATNDELESLCGRVNSRISDVRQELNKFGWTVYGKRLKGAVWIYRLAVIV